MCSVAFILERKLNVMHQFAGLTEEWCQQPRRPLFTLSSARNRFRCQPKGSFYSYNALSSQRGVCNGGDLKPAVISPYIPTKQWRAACHSCPLPCSPRKPWKRPSSNPRLLGFRLIKAKDRRATPDHLSTDGRDGFPAREWGGTHTPPHTARPGSPAMDSVNTHSGY